MIESAGTTKEEAVHNQTERQNIISKPDVVSLYHTYVFAEGMVGLNEATASNHVRHVLNELKKSRNKGLHDLFL